MIIAGREGGHLNQNRQELEQKGKTGREGRDIKSGQSRAQILCAIILQDVPTVHFLLSFDVAF